MFTKGDTVRLMTDPHERNRGEVLGNVARRVPVGFGRFGKVETVTFVQVRWNSGVVETVHESELRLVA